MREFKIDIQIDSYAFACFIKAFGECDGFCAMPWKEREEIMRIAYSVDVTERTLKSWGAKLIDRGLLCKDGMQSHWRTLENGQRELVDGDEEAEKEMRAYWSERAQIIKNYKGNDKKDAYKTAFNTLWKKYGCCYYTCKGFSLSAFDNYTKDLFQ